MSTPVEVPCLTFSDSEAWDECKHCGWTEDAHDIANAVRQKDADLRAKVQALVEKLETDLAMSQVTGAYEATDTLQMLIESPEFVAVKAAIEGRS